MNAITYGDTEAEVSCVVRRLVRHVHVGDIGFRIRQRSCHARQNALAVGNSDQKIGFEGPYRLVGPIHCNKSLAVPVLQAFGHGAIVCMDNQTFAAAQIPNDGITWNRTAAGSKLNRCTFAPVQQEAALRHGVVSNIAFPAHK